MSPAPTDGQRYLRRLLSPSEETVEEHLTEIATGRGWRIYTGVKLTAVVDPMPPGIGPRDWYDTATRQHLDFVVTDEGRAPLFAVELDDPTHHRPDAIRRDRIKDAVLEAADLEVLRIETRHLNRLTDGRSLVEYLVDARDFTAAYEDAQDQGLITRDEWPDYRLLISTGPHGISFDNDLAMEARKATFLAHRAGKTTAMYPGCGNFYWKDGWAEGWAWLEVQAERFLFADVKLRSYRFRCSVGPGELAEDLAVAAIGRDLQRFLAGTALLLPTSELTKKFHHIAQRRDEVDPEVTFFPFGERTEKTHICAWPPSCSVLHPPP